MNLDSGKMVLICGGRFQDTLPFLKKIVSSCRNTAPSVLVVPTGGGDGLYGGGGPFGASLQGRRLSGWEPITPGGFDKHPPHVGIACLGDRAPLPAAAAGMLAGDQTDKGHQLARQVKAGEVPQFSQGRDGGERVHAAQGHQPARLTLPRPPLERLLQRLVQPLDPGLGFLYRVHVFLKDDLLAVPMVQSSLRSWRVKCASGSVAVSGERR